MPLDYVLKRIGFFIIIVWLAATLNFFIPRLSSQNPIRERLIEQAVRSEQLRDQLTGLPNDLALTQRLEAMIQTKQAFCPAR